MEAKPYVDLILKHNISFCIFDFAGSGLSEGEYVTLGHNEKVHLLLYYYIYICIINNIKKLIFFNLLSWMYKLL